MKKTGQTPDLCPICGQGHVKQVEELVDHEYVARDGVVHHGQVKLHYGVCDTCHSDFAGAVENRLNKRAVLSFRKQVDGLLSGEEIRKMREALDLNQKQAAQLFGGGPVAFSKYENDEIAHNTSMDKLMRLAMASSQAFYELVQMAKLQDEIRRPAARKYDSIWCSVEGNVVTLVEASNTLTPLLHSKAITAMARAETPETLRVAV